jgi:hypothetical protein
MPAVDRQLAGDNGGAEFVAVIEDLQKVVTGGGIEAQVASVAAGEHEIGEELGVR